MDEALPSCPVAARPAQGCGRKFPLGAVCFALLSALLAAGLSLWARTPIRDKPQDSAEDQVARLAGEYQSASPSGTLQDILAQRDLIPSHDHPLRGLPAPDFELTDSEGRVWNLRELRADGPVVLIFYYGYYCNHCVRQLFDVQRDLPLFREMGARVAAISADAPELTRRRFERYGPFGFPVLSDPENKVAHTYRVFRGDFLRHGTFVIDRTGTVQWVNVGDAPFRRNSALLYQLAQLEDRLPSAPSSP